MKRNLLGRAVAAMGLAAALADLPAGCSRPAEPAAVAHHHEHHPPHGGTPVVLGNEAYHIELVRDADSGLLQAYVLDGEMENFVRCAQASLVIRTTNPGSSRTIELSAVANAATGETVGDTSLYQARADWIRTTPTFDAVLESITVRGSSFSRVTFNFPRGNDTD